MSAQRPNAEVLTMKRFRLRLSWLMWLVAIAAAFLGGIQYGEYRAAARRQSIVVFTPDGKIARSFVDKVEVTKNPNIFTPDTGP
jgi:hypothetical protein